MALARARSRQEENATWHTGPRGASSVQGQEVSTALDRRFGRGGTRGVTAVNEGPIKVTSRKRGDLRRARSLNSNVGMLEAGSDREELDITVVKHHLATLARWNATK
jgi:hypothetical protein